MKCLIGYGNTLRQDDGVGCWIAKQLTSDYDAADVLIIAAHQLLPEIAFTVMQSTQAIFVDAALEGKAGRIHVQQIAPLTHLEDAHALTPAGILYLCGMLGGQAPPAHLVTITGENFDLGEAFSDAVQASLPDALQTVHDILDT